MKITTPTCSQQQIIELRGTLSFYQNKNCSKILSLSTMRDQIFLFTKLRNNNNMINNVNSRKHVDSEKIRAPDGIWTHDPPWSSRMLYHWATGDSVVSKGQIVGIDWNRIARLHSHVLAHMNSLTASRCHINASHMNSHHAVTLRHIKMRPTNLLSEYTNREITTTW